MGPFCAWINRPCWRGSVDKGFAYTFNWHVPVPCQNVWRNFSLPRSWPRSCASRFRLCTTAAAMAVSYRQPSVSAAWSATVHLMSTHGFIAWRDTPSRQKPTNLAAVQKNLSVVGARQKPSKFTDGAGIAAVERLTRSSPEGSQRSRQGRWQVSRCCRERCFGRVALHERQTCDEGLPHAPSLPEKTPVVRADGQG